MEKQWQIFVGDDVCEEYFDNSQQAIAFLNGIMQMFPAPMELEIAIYERNDKKVYTPACFGDPLFCIKYLKHFMKKP
jgi:hypothetical protein